VASVAHLAPIHLGLDVHRDTISVGILAPGREVPVAERIAHDEASIRRLVGRLGDPRRLRACYQAGPTGYEPARLLDRMGIGCEVIAPSLIPPRPVIGSRPTRATVAGWPGCTGPGSWWPSASPRRQRRPCGICAVPGRRWSRI